MPMLRQLPEGFSYHFFVSYTTRDGLRKYMPTVDRLCQQLRNRGFAQAPPFFFDRLTLPQKPTTDPELAIALQEGIAHSVCMLAFLSRSYHLSYWCLSEWHGMEAYERIDGPPLIDPFFCGGGYRWPPALGSPREGRELRPDMGPAELLDVVEATDRFIESAAARRSRLSRSV
jgi:hypothetical protein